MEQIKLFGKDDHGDIEERVNRFICELGPEVKIIDICYKHLESYSYSAMVRYNDPVLDYWVEKLKEVCHQTSDECSPGLMGAETKGFIVAKGDRIGDFVKGYLLRHMKCRSGLVSRTDYWKPGESEQYYYDKYREKIQEMAADETTNCLIIKVDDPKILCNMCGYFLQLVKHEKPLISKHGKEYIFDGFVVIEIEKLDEVVKYAAEHNVAEFEELTTYYKMLG